MNEPLSKFSTLPKDTEGHAKSAMNFDEAVNLCQSFEL